MVKTQVSSPGVVLPLAQSAVIDGDEVRRRVYDRKEGRIRTVSSEEVEVGGLAFPDEFTWSGGKPKPKDALIMAAVGDHVRRVPEKEVRYVVVHQSDLFSSNVNATPFLGHNSGPRIIMGSNQMTQGIGLKEPESPLVRSLAPDGESFDRKIGAKYNVKSPVKGIVESVGYDKIVIKDTGGKRHTLALLRDLPLNQGSFIDQEATVKPGDEVDKGQLVSRNNYTDAEGNLAIGRNLHVAYMPMDGWNHEDGIVMSRKGADKLTSVHMKEFTVEVFDNDQKGAGNYNTYLRKQGKYLKPSNEDKLDADGLIKVGETVEPGEVIAAIITHSGDQGDSEFSRTLKSIVNNLNFKWRDRSLYWEENHPGEVVRVVKTPTKWTVFIKTEAPFKVGDKLSNRFGAKGIVSKIYENDQMPAVKRPDGTLEVLDMIVDPHGVPSRANPGQIMELAAGKIAKETGKPYEVNNFDPDALEKLRKDLDALGISDKDTVVDPTTGREIPNVATGYVYNAKLRHQLDKKFNVRQTFGDGYDLNELPINGAAIDKLTIYSLIGHNARANLAEMANLKGTKNEAYWSAIANGQRAPRVSKSPFSFEKMKALMTGMGVSVERRNDELVMTPLTDDEIIRQSRGAITVSSRRKARKSGPTPTKGGLWDPSLVSEEGWNHIELPEPVPNPAFVKPIALLIKNAKPEGVRLIKRGKDARLSELAFSDIESIFVGDSAFVVDGKEMRGGAAIQEVLRRIDLDNAIEQSEDRLKSHLAKPKINASTANELHQALRFAKTLKAEGIRPEKAYVMTKVPVIPAVFRQPIEDSSGNWIQTSVDMLYGELIDKANSLAWGHSEGFDDDDIKLYRRGVFDSFGALVGAKKSRNTGDFAAVGILDQLSAPKSKAGREAYDLKDAKGSSPKSSFPQAKVVKKPMELSGRTTIIPDPGLDIDEAGIPEEAAWAMYEPFVRNRLSKMFQIGKGNEAGREALRHFRERSPSALLALKAEMAQRPVLLNRAPSWWQYNVMAFKPTLITNEEDDGEKALRVPSMVIAPYMGGDYDGDALNMHVPAEDEAVIEAYKMMPSRHLRAVGTKKIMIVPDQSMLIGLYHMTGWNSKGKAKDIDNVDDALKAGRIRLDEVIRVGGRTTTAGWEILDEVSRKNTPDAAGIDDLVQKYNKREGTAYSRKDFFFTKSTLKPFLDMLIEEYPDDFARIVQAFAKMGDHHATRYGVSIGLSDLTPMRNEVAALTRGVQPLIPKLAKEIAAANNRKKPVQEDIDAATVQLFDGDAPVTVGGKSVASVRMQLDELLQKADAEKNQFIRMMQVGSKGNKDQIRQVLAAPLIMQDVMKRKVPVPITNSYAGGLSTGEYFIQQHGTLKGLRDRAVETREPGDIGKQMLSTSAPLVVSESDCGTTNGETESTAMSNKEDVLDRVLAKAAGGVAAGTVIDGRVFAQLSKRVDTVVVRSPMTCEAENGVCQKCFGLQANGQFPVIGENVGVQQAQAIVEPLANAKLKSFHSTGAGSSSTASLIERVDEIVNLKTPTGKATIIAEADYPADHRFVITRIQMNVGQAGATSNFLYYKPFDGGAEQRLRIAPSQKIIVREGQTVVNGDPVTDGPIDPAELQAVRGFRAVQRYVADELKGWAGVKKRTAETLTAAMSRMGKVIDPGDSDYTHYDSVPVGQILGFNRRAEKEGKQTIVFEPQIHGIGKIPKEGEDWLPKLDFRNIKDQILHAGTVGARSPLHGPNPMSAYIFGREMDQGQSGNWYY